MPKLFVASGIFHPEAGGPATYLRAILPALQDTGWQVRAQSFGEPSDSAYPYPVSRIRRRWLPLRRAHYAMAARSHLAWADLVYSHSIDLPLWNRRDIPRVIKIVGDQAWERCMRRGWIPPDLDIDSFQRAAGDIRVRWQQQSRSRQVRAMDAVIVPSEYLKRKVLGWGVIERKVHVIYNALPGLPTPPPDRAQLRHSLGLDEAPTLIAVARLQHWKGIDHVIAAIKDLPEIRLIVAGEGPDAARLRLLAAPLGERVSFHRSASAASSASIHGCRRRLGRL